MPCLIGQMLADVVQREGASAGSLDGWGWRELKVLPVSWYDGHGSHSFQRLRTLVFGLMGYWMFTFTMIPKSDGDATPLGQRPLSVLPIVYRIWASTRMGQLGDWVSVLGP